MKNAWMLSLVFLYAAQAQANGAGHHGQETSVPVLEKIAEPPKAPEKQGPVVAMDAEHARSYHTNELITAGSEPLTLVGRTRLRAELSPRSVADFDDEGGFRLLRGSAVVEQPEETSARTPGARIEFVGKSILSYDHQEKSTSIFVLEGEARVVNPHRHDSTLKLSRFRGATIVVGEVLPKLVRQLDVGEVRSWMKGFSWPEARTSAMLKNMPSEKIVAQKEEPEHLKDAKIEDYFSSIDTADEQQQPDYYRKKFDDPDKVVAEANSKQGSGKTLSPEEAALISLPKTQIDLGFELGPEFLSAEQKAAELSKVEPKSLPKRGPASVAKAEKPKAVKPKAAKKIAVEQGDPEVNMVLERLRQVRSDNTVFSQVPSSSRQPASVPTSVVPDPVYDYSQNF